jgi:hypothetical protein
MDEQARVNGEEFIELRVQYPTRARLYRIDGLNSRSCTLNRVEVGDYLPYGKEFPKGGDAVAVYGLPLYHAVYELRQIIDGRRATRFFAVCDGVLHPILRDSVERIAENSLTLQQWAASIAHDDDEVSK